MRNHKSTETDSQMRTATPARAGWKCALAAFLLASPLVYFVHVLALFMLDTFAGDRTMLNEYFVRHLRRKLVLDIITGGLHALPLLYAGSAVLLVVVIPVVRWSYRWGVILGGLVGLAAGILLSVRLFGHEPGAMVPFGTSGLLMGVTVGLVACCIPRPPVH